MKTIQKLFQKVGLDKAILLTITTRIVQAGGGLISIFFIAGFLNGNEQGYFYTFASIIAIQVFFELGLSGIITQYAAHEFVHLEWGNEYELLGESSPKSRLSSLLHFCVKWFGIVSVALFGLLVGFGFYFFASYSKTAGINWQGPWIILCAATSLNLFIDPILAFYEGLGEVKDMAKLRLIQKILYLVFLFVFFALGFKLYSSALASLLAIVVNYFQVAFSKRIKILKAIWLSLATEKIEYMKEIFPYQWRIALSWISGYFIFQLFNPVLFATQGAKVAGQMGMTLQALNGVSALSMSWISTKVPLFSSYIAKKDFKLLDTTFNLTVKQLASVNILLLAILIGMVLVLRFLNSPLSDRFLGLVPIILLCAATFVNQFIFSWATYLRCHKKEPFLVISIAGGLLCGLSTLLLGNLFGLYGIVIGYSTIVIVISLPWSFYIFSTKKKEWHV